MRRKFYRNNRGYVLEFRLFVYGPWFKRQYHTLTAAKKSWKFIKANPATAPYGW